MLVKNKFVAIAKLITDRNLSVLTITETWHQPHDLSSKKVAPPGYGLVDVSR